jgi:uncharacterized protein (TIGR00730 family)
MSELSDGFVALPGGFGTLDELLEQLTWSQLGLHAKPIGLLDAEGYWRPLIALDREEDADDERTGHCSGSDDADPGKHLKRCLHP